MTVRAFEYTENEAYLRETLRNIKAKLLIDLESFQQAVDLANTQIRSIDRCQDAWIAEVLFRRGIPIADFQKVDFGEEGFEVDDDQPA